jgi:hypothetical protein
MKMNWGSRRRAKEAAKFSRMVEEFWLNDGRLFRELEQDREEPEDDVEDELLGSGEPEEWGHAEKREIFNTTNALRPDETGLELFVSIKQEQAPIRPSGIVPIRLFKKRKTKPGRSVLGTSVLSMKGSVGDATGPLIDLRVDTCADLTLMSEELYLSLPNRPPIRQGLPMKLVQLTHEESDIKGYVNVPLFVMSEDGSLIEMEAEAYVVPGMSVPILLGEDDQLNYEITVTRNLESGTKIHFQGWRYTVRAQNVSCTNDFGRILFSNRIENKHVKAKRHRSKLVREKRRSAKFGEEKRTVRAAHDYKIRPHKCRSILLEGYFEQDKEWLVEKSLLANANDSYFAVPNTLISSHNPWLPISNPTDQPKMIRKGEVVGTLRDPQEFFDKPGSAEGRSKFVAAAEALGKIIEVNLRNDEGLREHLGHYKDKVVGCKKCYPNKSEDPTTENAAEEAEDYGPKQLPCRIWRTTNQRDCGSLSTWAPCLKS